jgi:hypothetical protein
MSGVVTTLTLDAHRLPKPKIVFSSTFMENAYTNPSS